MTMCSLASGAIVHANLLFRVEENGSGESPPAVNGSRESDYSGLRMVIVHDNLFFSGQR